MKFGKIRIRLSIKIGGRKQVSSEKDAKRVLDAHLKDNSLPGRTDFANKGTYNRAEVWKHLFLDTAY